MPRTVPEHAAGSASGVLTTAQQVGAALGIAVSGVLFFGAIDSGSYPDALALGLASSLGAAAVTAVLALRLARRDRYREARWSSSRTSPTSSSAVARTGG